MRENPKETLFRICTKPNDEWDIKQESRLAHIDWFVVEDKKTCFS
jgi:hypothetical protein